MCHAWNVLLLVNRGKFSQRGISWRQCEFLCSCVSRLQSEALGKQFPSVLVALHLNLYSELSLKAAPLSPFLCCRLIAAALHNSGMLFLWPPLQKLHISHNGKEPEKAIAVSPMSRCKGFHPVGCYSLCLFVQAALSLNVSFCSLTPIPPSPSPPPAPPPSTASNPCEKNDGRGPCSHLCLINYNRTASCTCPHLMKLSPNKQSCFGEWEPACPAPFCSSLRWNSGVNSGTWRLASVVEKKSCTTLQDLVSIQDQMRTGFIIVQVLTRKIQFISMCFVLFFLFGFIFKSKNRIWKFGGNKKYFLTSVFINPVGVKNET